MALCTADFKLDAFILPEIFVTLKVNLKETSWGKAGPSSSLKFELQLKLITASLGCSGWIGGGLKQI